MKQSLSKIIEGYHQFRNKYALGDNAIMHTLAHHGQRPEVMVVACCDSRVDPALILQCDPGELFVVRNVANIVPPYEHDDKHHGTSAALEFGICYLKVKHLILLGHSQCGGIQALLDNSQMTQNDFISNWVSLIDSEKKRGINVNDYAKFALTHSYHNCKTFPWIKSKLDSNELKIHLWFFDINRGEIQAYSEETKKYLPLS